MSDQREGLDLIARRGREGRSTSFRTVAHEFLLSEAAACGRLQRLWRERLIESPERPERYGFHVQPGESIRELRFQLSARGRERLRWYTREEKKNERDWF